MAVISGSAVFRLLGLVGWLVPAAVLADPVGRALELQTGIQKQAARIQKRIDALDDETRRMVTEYQAKLAQLDQLTRYDEQLEKLIADQEQELAQRQRQLQQLEILKRRLFPFMLEMVAALEKIVAVDTPFLVQERRQRLQALRALMNRADVPLPEKYHRLMEAFRIEAQYGHDIETYEGDLKDERGKRTVKFLRFGRLGLYYLTLDGREAGVWDPTRRRWKPLDRALLRPLAHAMRIAAKQAPPDLVVLPVPAPEAP